jgi:flagellar hook-associated protein 3 FlgL
LSGVAQPAYAPDAGEQRIGEGGRYAATVDGGPAFMNIPQGNGVFVTASAAGNTGSAWIGAGNVTSPAQLTGHSYSITIAGAPGAQTYTVMDTTASTTVVPATAFKPGEAIAFAGQQVTISGTPAAGDSFSLQPTSNQSVFKTLDDAITLLKNGTLPKPQYNEQLERVQSSLDRALDGMVLARSRVGTQLQATDSGAASNSQQEVAATQRHSDLVDMDVVQGLSELQSGQTALQAALQSYAAIGRTSLFELLR